MNSTVPAFSAVFAITGTSVTSPATLGTIETALRTTSADPCGAPHPIGMNSHDIEQQQNDERRHLPEQIETDDAEPHQREQQHEIDTEH